MDQSRTCFVCMNTWIASFILIECIDMIHNFRTELAQFPESTGNTSYLQHVRNEKEARSILEKTKEAGPLCKEYCDSLANEVY